MTQLPSMIAAAMFACASSVVQAMTTADDFSKAIVARGAEAVVAELAGERSEFDRDRLFEGVASGRAEWLRVAATLRPHTDAGFSSELEDALMAALIKAPNNVTHLLSTLDQQRRWFELESVCGDQMFSDGPARYQAILQALAKLKSPRSPTTVKQCRAVAESALKRALAEEKKKA